MIDNYKPPVQPLAPKLSKDGSVHVTNEQINTISHLVASCFSFLGAVLLIAEASTKGEVWKIVGFGVYGTSLLGLFIFSTLHHGLNSSIRVNKNLRTLDYSAVFGLIGGTVTPLVLVKYRTVTGWSTLGVVWTVAIVGITLRWQYEQLPRYITNTFYIVLGWLPVILISDGARLSVGAVGLLAGGGILYSIGFICYTLEKPNIKPGIFGFHEIWHLLVVAAAFMHYLMMYFYILPG